MQRLDVGSIGTETIFGDNEVEMRVVLTQLAQEAFGCIAFTIIFGHAILVHNGFGHQRNHFTKVRMDNRRAQHLVRIGDGTVAVDLVQTRLTVNRLGGEIPRAIEGEQIGPLKEHHRFQRFAALELSKDALEARTQ